MKIPLKWRNYYFHQFSSTFFTRTEKKTFLVSFSDNFIIEFLRRGALEEARSEGMEENQFIWTQAIKKVGDVYRESGGQSQ